MASGSYLKKSGPKRFMKEQWDSLLWIFASFAILYYNDFASNILFNPKVKRSWELFSFLNFAVAAFCVIKIACRSPRLPITNWDSTPTPTIGLVSGIMGSVSFIIAVWPIWRYWTLLIVSVLFMGFISAVSMF